MKLERLLDIELANLSINEVIASESINNLLAGCGISSGSGKCGKHVVN